MPSLYYTQVLNLIYYNLSFLGENLYNMAYSIDFIKRAVAYKQGGHTLKQLQEAFGVPAETYYDLERKT